MITIGPIGNDAAKAIAELEAEGKEQCEASDESKEQCEGKPLSIAHYDLRFLKPLDNSLLEEVGKKFKHIVTIEDGVRNGGMGSAVLEWMSDHGYQPTITRMGLPDYFVEHGTVNQLREIVHLDNNSIKETLKAVL